MRILHTRVLSLFYLKPRAQSDFQFFQFNANLCDDGAKRISLLLLPETQSQAFSVCCLLLLPIFMFFTSRLPSCTISLLSVVNAIELLKEKKSHFLNISKYTPSLLYYYLFDLFDLFEQCLFTSVRHSIPVKVRLKFDERQRAMRKKERWKGGKNTSE